MIVIMLSPMMETRMRKPLGTAVVTGASSGLGSVYADRLAKRGYDLLLVARRGDRLETLAKTLRGAHGVAVATDVADLSNPVDLARVAAAVAAEDVTLIVNNAGSATMGALGEATAQTVDGMTELNITALARLTLAVLPGFKARNAGTIINIGSVLSYHALPISSAYSGTKAYVMNFTRGLQDEVAGTGVRVQLVLPATTATEIWERGGLSVSAFDPATVMTAEDCVDAALAGLDAGETITLPSVEDASLFAAYDAARMALFAGGRSGTPATRYRLR